MWLRESQQNTSVVCRAEHAMCAHTRPRPQASPAGCPACGSDDVACACFPDTVIGGLVERRASGRRQGILTESNIAVCGASSPDYGSQPLLPMFQAHAITLSQANTRERSTTRQCDGHTGCHHNPKRFRRFPDRAHAAKQAAARSYPRMDVHSRPGVGCAPEAAGSAESTACWGQHGTRGRAERSRRLEADGTGGTAEPWPPLGASAASWTPC